MNQPPTNNSDLPPNDPLSSKRGSLEAGMAGDFDLRPVDIMGEAWDTLDGLKLPVILSCLAIFAVGIGFEIVLYLLQPEAALGEVQLDQSMSELTTELVVTLLHTLVTVPMSAGLFIMSLKHSAGGEAYFGEIGNYFDKALPFLALTIVSYILIFIGLLLLILPGLYLAICFYFAVPLMADKNLGVVDALKASRQAVHHQFFKVLGLMILSLLILIVGVIPFGIGLIWAIPVVCLMMAIAYRTVFGIGTNNSRTF